VFLSRLTLRHFRNFDQQTLSPFAGRNLIFGQNAQGKTNLIEAIHLLTYLRSFRTGRERELIMRGREWAMIEAELMSSRRGREHIRLVLRGGQKYLRVNGAPVARQEDYLGLVLAHFFIPSDLRLIAGEPRERRALLDVEVVRALPRSAAHIRAYYELLDQRNALLRELAQQEGPPPESTHRLLRQYGAQLAEEGSRLVEARMRLLAEIIPRTERFYRKMSGGRETLALTYRTYWGEEVAPEQFDPRGYRQRMEQDLSGELFREIEIGHTRAGPHRDDLEFALEGRLVKNFGSQGQMRSAVLAFKLALCEFTADYGEPPILCLDDALSELDDARRLRLVEILGEIRLGQVFITAASRRECAPLEGQMAKLFLVEAGTIRELTEPLGAGGAD